MDTTSKDLQYDGVSGGEGVDDWTETAPDWIIPGSHDKDDTQRFFADSRLVELEGNRDGDVFLFCPFIDLR
jgi:hypothetical protein